MIQGFTALSRANSPDCPGWATDGGFLRHIILYNINRVKPEMIAALIYPIHEHLIYVALAGVGAVTLFRRVRNGWPERANDATRLAAMIAILTYFAIKTLLLPMIMKSGANYNYVIEWLCAVAVLCGVAILPAIETAVAQFQGRHGKQTASLLLPTAVLFAVAAQAQRLPHSLTTTEDNRASAAQTAPVVALIRATPGPVISDDMSLLIRAGRAVEWEPAIAAELGAAGRYDQAAFVRMIRQKRFALFITEGDRGGKMYDQRYNPPVADAIASAYPHESTLGVFTIHAPR